MQEVNFDEVVEWFSTATRAIRAKPTRLFARRSISPRNSIGKETQGQIRHVSGQELLDGIRQFALQQFGPMVDDRA